VWIDTKQLSAVVDPIQLNLRMWTGGGSGSGGGLTWLVGRVESFSCYTTARVFSRPASGPAALCLFFFPTKPGERRNDHCLLVDRLKHVEMILCCAQHIRTETLDGRWMGTKRIAGPFVRV
jgi:hypothetical protein